MAATERVLSERRCSTKREASRELVSTKSMLLCMAREQNTAGSVTFEAQPVPPNHKVLKRIPRQH